MLRDKPGYQFLALNGGILLFDCIVFVVLGASLTSVNFLVRIASIIVIVMSVAAFFILNYRILSTFMEQQKKMSPNGMAVNMTVINAGEKENYRETLKRYRTMNPALTMEIQKAAEQMDSIDRKKRKLHEVMQRNKVDYNSLEKTGAQTEEVIYHNIRYIINRITIWDEKEYHDPKKAYIYEDHLQQIQHVLEKNDEILTEFDLFLMEVSKIENQVIQKDSSLEAAIIALKKLL